MSVPYRFAECDIKHEWLFSHGKWFDQVEGTGTGEALSVKMRLDRMGWCGMIDYGFVHYWRKEDSWFHSIPFLNSREMKSAGRAARHIPRRRPHTVRVGEGQGGEAGQYYTPCCHLLRWSCHACKIKRQGSVQKGSAVWCIIVRSHSLSSTMVQRRIDCVVACADSNSITFSYGKRN